MSKILKLNFEAEPMSLDPRIGVNVMSQSVIRCLFEGLMKISDTGEITNGITEKFSISDDQKTYVFKLRDAYWNDGQKVSAHDFEYAWKSAIAPSSQCRIVQLFYPIKNVTKIRENLLPIEKMGVYAIDKTTLRIDLEHPVPFFLKLLANPLFSPVRKDSDFSNDKFGLISNGPFQLKKYELNKGIYLVKNPNYHLKDLIKIDGIEISFMKDSQTVMYMFEKKEIDFIGNPISKIPFEEEEKLVKSNQLHIKPIAGIYWLGLKTNQFPYNNIHFRKALAYSLDNELFSQALNQRKAAKTFVPLALSNLDKFSSWYNPKEAQEQLNQALLELNYKLEDLPSLKLTFCNQISNGKKIALLLKKQWEDNLNVSVELQEMEWKTYLDALFKNQLEIGGLPWYSYIEDASYHLETFKHSSYTSNWTLWENEQFIENLDKCNQASNMEKRSSHLFNAEKIIENEMPVIPLFYEDYRYLHQSNVHNIVMTDMGEIEFRYCYID